MTSISSSTSNIYLTPVSQDIQDLFRSYSAIILLCDDNTERLCLPYIRSIGIKAPSITIPHGEQNKNLESIISIWHQLIELGADRQSLILTLGGGMVSDTGGFAAACFQRGISIAHIPTTLLAMTDAAIGGKTGVDFAELKNYIGKIHFPAFVWVDTRWLQTLEPTEIKNGLAEIIKHAIIGSRALWDMLSAHASADTIVWDDVLPESISVKVKIVEADPYESGLRKTLNFGHTIGHALESRSWQTDLPLQHGQAVAMGMLAELKISQLAGLLSQEDFEDIVRLISKLLSPLEASVPSYEEIEGLLKKDKKNFAGKIGFSLPDGIGSCQWNVNVSEEMIRESIAWLSAQGKGVNMRLESREPNAPV
jgi:3-dehydroquinate synthase